jgi:hypothetical protein
MKASTTDAILTRKERAENIHREMKTVLQIILVTQKFEPGLYHLENPYTTDWVKI